MTRLGAEQYQSLYEFGISRCIFSLQVQNNKQLLSSLHRKSRDRSNIEPYKIPTDITSRMNAKWSNEELLLGVQGNQGFLFKIQFCVPYQIYCKHMKQYPLNIVCISIYRDSNIWQEFHRHCRCNWNKNRISCTIFLRQLSSSLQSGYRFKGKDRQYFTEF